VIATYPNSPKITAAPKRPIAQLDRADLGNDATPWTANRKPIAARLIVIKC
jgi:hypothetical protein